MALTMQPAFAPSFGRECDRERTRRERESSSRPHDSAVAFVSRLERA